MAKKKVRKSLKIKKSFFEPKHIIYLIIFASLSVGFVYSRMRGVELQYQVNKLVKHIERESQTNKKLKAQIEDLKSKDDLVTRNSQDMILSIKSKLKLEDDS